MLRMFAVASLVMLGASPIPNAAAPGAIPAIASTPVHDADFHGTPSARDTMNESLAHMAIRAATPGADAASLSQRDRFALLVLLSLHGNAGATGR